MKIKCRFCDQQWTMNVGEGSGSAMAEMVFFEHLSLDHPEKYAELMAKQKQLALEYIELEKEEQI